MFSFYSPTVTSKYGPGNHLAMNIRLYQKLHVQLMFAEEERLVVVTALIVIYR